MTNRIESTDLKELIEIKREELNEVVNTERLTEKILELSMELDQLINNYMGI
ncbi:MAG: aspartyl-phosphate phosphatase Spo0E family protein [Tissierellia bacterium]|mgnify:CR=1 FL=1|nr:aspartyl-phosphate phosphatase Spo0E family protein [Tissierellia bacterium]